MTSDEITGIIGVVTIAAITVMTCYRLYLDNKK